MNGDIDEKEKKDTPDILKPKNISLISGAVLAAVILCFFVSLAAPASFRKTEQKLLYITYGSGFKKITGELEKAGLLRNPSVFGLCVLAGGLHKKFKAGEYEFSTADSGAVIAWKMVRGDVKKHRVVVPEGSDIYDVAAILEQAGLLDGAEFLEAAADKDFLLSLGINKPGPEGYLFPDTYNFILGETPKKIIRTMRGRFGDKAIIDINREYEIQGLTINGYKLLVLASIIEKEARLDEERPLIASVFINRLKSPEAYQRRLESCATVRYALNKKAGVITYKDLRNDSPYNTYIRIGLPPGPICNPGLKSMAAALKPARTDYRYFVVYENGEHTFSVTLEDHNNAKAMNRKKRRADGID